MSKYPLPAILHINDPETLKIISDPLRLRILEAMGAEPITVKQVAARIGMQPGKLYYHINLMEKHGIIQVADTRVVSGIIEKLYSPAAESFKIDRNLIQGEISSGEESSLFHIILSTTRDEVVAGVRSGQINLAESASPTDRMHFQRSKFLLTADQIASLYERLEALLNEYSNDEGDPPPEAKPYRLLTMLYPAVEMDRGTEPASDENQKGAE